MIGILIIAHGDMGKDLVLAASHVLGAMPVLVRPMSVTVSDDPDALMSRAREYLHELDEGQGVLVLTDIFGATPGNIAMRLLDNSGRVEGVSGVNLPMLVRALTYRNEALGTVVEKALSGGTQGVVHMNIDCCNAQR